MASISSWRFDLVAGSILHHARVVWLFVASVNVPQLGESANNQFTLGVFCPKIGVVHPRLPSHIVPGRSITHLSLGSRAVKCASFVEKNYQSSVNDEDDPFLINAMKQAIWSVKSILLFLFEQPGQLKYIEWPGFQSTLKTATLALVLVGLFIVALSSIDSALSYMLILFLRIKA